MELLLVGDVHGKIERFQSILDHNSNNCDLSIQLGDLGFDKEYQWFLNKYKDTHHYVLQGNHDNPKYKDFPNVLGNWFYFKEPDIFSIRGADSIDKVYRTEGIDWFPEEELTYKEQLEAYDNYVINKPAIMLSHDCPQSIAHKLFRINSSSPTRSLLEHCLKEHPPKLWVFGHHHKSIKYFDGKTLFVCLDELETFKLKL